MTNPAVRRALAMFLATGAALVGLVMLVVSWTMLGKATLLATHDQDKPCLVAFADQQSGARVHYDLLPARSVCTWDVDGVQQDVVISQASTTVTATAVGLVVVGVGVTTVLLVAQRRATRRSSGPGARPAGSTGGSAVDGTAVDGTAAGGPAGSAVL